MSSTWTQHLALELLARQIAYMSRLEVIQVSQGLKYLHPGCIFNEEGYLERDVCENLVDMFDGITLYPLHTQIHRIKDEQISLPNVNIGLKGSKFSSISCQRSQNPSKTLFKPQSKT